MSWIQNGKSRNREKPISGCLGRMVNLFDLNTRGNKLLTDKAHHDGSSSSRRQSDVTGTSLVDDQMVDKRVITPLNRTSNGTPIKMLIAQEMSKEEDCKQSPSNLVAKLMGLDSLPHEHQLASASHMSQPGTLESLHQEHGFMETKSKHEANQKMAFVQEKFLEAKRLSTDDKLRQSKQFQDALEVLSSNKDMFLKILQEPNSLYSQNLYGLQSVTPPPDSRRITILKPSKLVDTENRSDLISSPESFKIDDNPTRPTRIVVLKPKVASSSPSSTSHDDIADETVNSSVFSNGYVGDDSSYSKSDIDYAAGNLSDSEVMSPTSRHSWDYINRFYSHYGTSSSRTSYYPESSVCREAKKRLSERWAMMSSNKNVPEQRQIQRSSSTLGDMLALSDLKKPVKPDDENHEEADKVSRNLVRSKSVPARLGVEVSGSLKDKAGDTKDAVNEKLAKSSSFKGRVSSLFFSKSKKSSKEKSHQANDAPQSSSFHPRLVGDERSQCTGDMVITEASCSTLRKSVSLPEVGFSFPKSEFYGNHIENQDQPSPISVLEPQFEEDEQRMNCHHNSKPHVHGIESARYNLIDKSPPIGSIARTLSWDDSVASPIRYSAKPSPAPLNLEEEEQECLFHVQTLLSVAGLDKIQSNSFLSKWHSPESPLDPSLRDKYMNQSEKNPMSLMTTRSKLRHHKAITRLVFDCVNEALIHIKDHGPYSGAHDRLDRLDDMGMSWTSTMSSTVLTDRVWGQIKEWMPRERHDWDDGDGGSVGIERAVMREVVGRGWVEGLRMEIDDARREIEGKLLEELVQECWS